MIQLLPRLTAALLWLTGLALSNKVNQSPSELMRDSGGSMKLNCSHDIPSQTTILWYHRAAGDSALTLMGYVYYTDPTVETLYKDHCSMSGDGSAAASLHVPKVNSNDSGVYFCAVREGNPAYFGDGTKLTVLEPGINITRPTVKVLPPSIREGCKKTNRTLVCVATGFYPDHITVSWKVNGVEVTSGVRTDDTALRDEDNRFYSITSRLRVSYRKWFDTRSTFTCLTRFYNGSGYPEDADSINGVNGGGMDREYLLKSGLTAKLSYSVFIAKSFLYGLFVSAVVWKIRSSAAKRYE